MTEIMIDYSELDVNMSSKKAIKSIISIGKVKLVPLEESIVERLGLNDYNTFIEEQVIDDGIFLRIIKDNSKQNE